MTLEWYPKGTPHTEVDLDPDTPGALMSTLGWSESKLVELFGELTPEEFYRSPAGKWSPDEHLRHLALSLGRTASALGTAPVGGDVAPAGRSYRQLRDDYRAALAAGGKAPPAFVPPPVQVQNANVQAKTVQNVQAAFEALYVHLREPEWTQERLDSVQLTHPLLGQISAREMLFFTVYHNLHHLEGARNSMEQR